MPKIPVVFLAFANDRVSDVAYLRNLPTELDGIRKNLYKAQQAGLCEVVERANVTIDNIFDVFQDPRYRDRIAILHYGGHANGYQLLLESSSGGVATAQSEGLVPYLARQNSLKLVFLNGCSSQQQAQDLVDAGVPAVIGTSQAINDDVATSLSVRFYSSLSGGNSIGRAWDESTDQVKVEKGTSNFRSLYFEGIESQVDSFPWNMLLKKGAEKILEWNLPEEVENPLFGLPEVPPAYDLPDEPFLFLRRYERRHAEIFFGRAYYIRELYDRLSNPKSAPLILLYGQSGVGKSSLLDAGLLPRMEDSHEVRYLRRNRNWGLLGTLNQTLNATSQADQQEQELPYEVRQKIAELETLSETADDALQQDIQGLIRRLKTRRPSPLSIAGEVGGGDAGEGTILERWKAIEAETGKPLIVILDQVEEVYTQPNPMLSHEFEDFLAEISNLFFDPTNRPQGKLLLSYRKEYHPEIEEQLKTMTIPRERVFLQHLRRKDIAEVVKGLTSTEQLQNRYGLEVQDTLPEIIADRLLSDKDSSVAPVLQILLTKMWRLTDQEDYRYFSVDLYTRLDKEGILLDDFFHQQMERIRAWDEETESSGLALDVLNFHTSAMGTANTRLEEELRERYGHQHTVVDPLTDKFKELYLLSDRAAGATGLAHDTLAPLVQNEYRNSDRTGQRAARILESKVIDFNENKKILLDKADLSMVEAGQHVMRAWSPQEDELVALSRKRRNRNSMIRTGIMAAGVVLALAILGLSILADKNADEARAQSVKAKEQQMLAYGQAIVAKGAQGEAQVSAEAAKLDQTRAEIEQIIADKARTQAERERKAADLARLKAQEEEQKAKLAALRAQAAQKAEAIAKRKADLDKFMAELSSADAQFGQFIAKSKELAVQATSLRDNPQLKSRLALTAFQLNERGFGDLEGSIEGFQRGLKQFDAEPLYRKEQPALVDSLGDLVLKLSRTAANESTSPEVFMALRDAYVMENSQAARSNASERDKMAAAESWALTMDGFGRVYYNDQSGKLQSASLFTQTATSLPSIENKGVLDNAGRALKVRSMLSMGRTLYAGLADGRLVTWKPYEENTPVVELWPVDEKQDAGEAIQALAKRSNQPQMFFVQNETLYQLDSGIDQPKAVANSPLLRSVKALAVVETGGDAFVLAATAGRNVGNLVKIYLSGDEAGNLVELATPTQSGIHGLAYSTASGYVAFTDAAGKLFLSDNITGSTPTFHEIGKEHRGIVRSLAFDGSGRRLATAGLDGLVTLRTINKSGKAWQEQIPDLQFSSINPRDNKAIKILSIAFSNAGDYLVFSDERELRICPTDPAAFNTRLCNSNPKELDGLAWDQYVGEGIPQEACQICETQLAKEKE